jgi:hypothetical protein
MTCSLKYTNVSHASAVNSAQFRELAGIDIPRAPIYPSKYDLEGLPYLRDYADGPADEVPKNPLPLFCSVHSCC